MFNETFYPTPRHVISRMVAAARDRIEKAIILEPSAGKGDILDYLTSMYRIHKDNLFAIEIEPELQAILADKDYTIIGTDFLAFDEPYNIGLILMNPPFNHGAEHVLKAWNVVKPGGMVVALVNSETLNNPHTRHRLLLAEIVEKHGASTELGPVFKDAEKRTNVSVAMIVLEKPERNYNKPLDGVDLDEDAPEGEVVHSEHLPAERDLIRSLVAQYDAAVRALRDKAEADARVAYYTQGVVDLRKRAGEQRGEKYTYVETWKPMNLNEEIQRLKTMFWAFVFEKTQLANVTTSSVREDFSARQKRQQRVAFTVENVYAVLEAVVFNAQDTIKQCVVDVFDTCTSYHEKNRIHHEGWKTNKSWKLSKKAIIPYFDSAFAYRAGQFLDDFDKALCMLTGKKFTEITQTRKVIDANRSFGTVLTTDEIESEFFYIRLYKKGTVHLTFKDLDLLARFNQTAAEGKHWVGAGY